MISDLIEILRFFDLASWWDLFTRPFMLRAMFDELIALITLVHQPALCCAASCVGAYVFLRFWSAIIPSDLPECIDEQDQA